MNISLRPLIGLVLFLAWPLSTMAAEDPRVAELKSLVNQLKYQGGQIDIRNGLATMQLTEGFRYLDPAGTETVLTRIWGNPSSGRQTLGMIVPKGFSPFATNS